jgi:antitoxin (DNA-binding transcriptional repressor) of toxin-antitoxin stability system
MMKVIEQQDATRPLAEYAAEIKGGTVVVTDHGRPVAALVPLENADLETVELSTNPHFMRLIERSRAAIRVEGGVSSADMRKLVQ